MQEELFQAIPIQKRQRLRMEFMPEELFSTLRSICGVVLVKSQRFRKEL